MLERGSRTSFQDLFISYYFLLKCYHSGGSSRHLVLTWLIWALTFLHELWKLFTLQFSDNVFPGLKCFTLSLCGLMFNNKLKGIPTQISGACSLHNPLFLVFCPKNSGCLSLPKLHSLSSQLTVTPELWGSLSSYSIGWCASRQKEDESLSHASYCPVSKNNCFMYLSSKSCVSFSAVVETEASNIKVLLTKCKA
jgi:hypothetical protein